MSFLTVQGIRILQVLVASTVVLALFFSLGHFGSDNLRDNVKVPARQSNLKLPFRGRAPQPKPANATLDFQEIIFLSMPYRTDRQDALSLIAAVTGLKLTMIPGVRQWARNVRRTYVNQPRIGQRKSNTPKSYATIRRKQEYNWKPGIGYLESTRKCMALHYRQQYSKRSDYRR